MTENAMGEREYRVQKKGLFFWKYILRHESYLALMTGAPTKGFVHKTLEAAKEEMEEYITHDTINDLKKNKHVYYVEHRK